MSAVFTENLDDLDESSIQVSDEAPPRAGSAV